MKTQAQYLNTRVTLLDTQKLGGDLAREMPDRTVRFEASWGLADTPAGPILLSRCGLGMARPISSERPGWIQCFADTPTTRVMVPTWVRLPTQRLAAYQTATEQTTLSRFLLSDPGPTWERAFRAAFDGPAGTFPRKRTGALTERELDAIAGELAAEIGGIEVPDLRDIAAEIDDALAEPGVCANRWGIVGTYIASRIKPASRSATRTA